MTTRRQFARHLAGLIWSLVAMPVIAAQTVVEYFDPGLNDFFITADPTEQVFVDSGVVGRPRTMQPGAPPGCRLLPKCAPDPTFGFGDPAPVC